MGDDKGGIAMICCFKQFNTACKLMLRALMRMAPDSSDLRMMHASYKVVKTFNRRTPHQFFEEVLGVHEDRLMSQDISFLLVHHEADAPPQEGAITDLQRTTCDVWPGLSQEDRVVIWGHIAEIVRLNRRCRSFDSFELGRSMSRVPPDEFS